MKPNEITGSKDFQRLNPHLFARAGEVATEKPKPAASQALVCGKPKQNQRPSAMAICCSFLAYRRRLLDDDNHIASIKPLRDAIANYLFINDVDPRIHWEYAQCYTRGSEEVIVRIEAQL